jgi:hypothetical protein
VETAETKVPSSAKWLGGLGAVPFVGLAGAIPFLIGAPRLLVVHALVTYGSTILSFLGGVHWGLAIRTPGSPDDGKLAARLTLSVIPSLVGWAALLVAERMGLWILAMAIAAMLWVDIRATRRGQAPPWYPRLRIPLTCTVLAALLFGALA